MHSPFEDLYESTFWTSRRRTAKQTETKTPCRLGFGGLNGPSLNTAVGCVVTMTDTGSYSVEERLIMKNVKLSKNETNKMCNSVYLA